MKVITKNIKGFLIGAIASAIANYITFHQVGLINVILSGLLGILIYRLLHMKY